ncbi:MAG: diguanylate cyclase [Acidiferrobacterales bacterium]
MTVVFDRLTKSISLLWLPVLLLWASVWFKEEAIDILRDIGVKPQLLFYSVCAAGIFLSWRFNRSRILFALVSLLLSYAFITAVAGIGRAVDEGMVSLVIGTLLAFNFFWIVLIPERGVVSSMGRLAAFIFAVEAGLVLLILSVPTLAPVLDEIRAFQTPNRIPDTSLSLVTIVAVGLSTAVILTRSIWTQSAIDAGLLAALLAATFGVNAIGINQAESLFFATAALVLQVTIIRDSHARVYTDELTRLPARRALDEQMMRLGKQYVIAMVDIDNFKRFNDEFGHDVGDQALRFVAAQLARTRGRAQAYRYGGEEFTLLFRGKTLEEVWAYIDQARERIDHACFTIRSPGRPRNRPRNPKGPDSRKTMSLTVSIGAAQRDAEHRYPEDVLRAADRQLYTAKQAGRNRTAIMDFG